MKTSNQLAIQVFFGVLGFLEIFLILVVVLEISPLLPIALGYSVFNLFIWGICSIFWLFYGVIQLSSEKDQNNRKDQVSLTDFVLAAFFMVALVTLYLLRFLSVLVVYRWSRIPREHGSSSSVPSRF